ncbi:ty3-gypsy retrotransposon protein [Tanacetum coccineum]
MMSLTDTPRADSGERRLGDDRADTLAQQQAATFQRQFDTLRAELQTALGLVQQRGGGGDQGLLLPRSMRLDVPKFTGEDPERWLFSITEYFTLLNTPVDKRLRIVGFNHEGAAAEWFRWMSRNGLITDWERFKESVMNRFWLSKYEDPQGALSKLLQLGTVDAYQGDAFALARVTEARLDDQAASMSVTATKAVTSSGGQRQPNPRFGVSSNQGAVTKPALLPTPSQTNINTNPKPLAIKWISPAERQERLNKGLCFNCDNKWARGHKCPGKFLLLMADDENDAEPENEPNSAEAVESGDISILNSLIGQGSPRSLQLWGSIGSGKVHVLIDNGSTHNFVRPDIVEKMQLPVQATKAFKVYIGSGESLLCENLCTQVMLSMQGLAVEVDLYVLPMKGPDVVLGIQWLQKLGKVTHDYAQQTMEFTLVNTTYTLKGDESLRMKRISLHHMQALLESDDVYGVYELYNVTKEAEEVEPPPGDAGTPPPEIAQLLERFGSLFQDAINFNVKSHKCHSGLTLDFILNNKLGHIISGLGVEVDSKKVAAVRDWPVPTTPRQGDLEMTAFEDLKLQLSTTPVLSLPDFEKTFIVETDAADEGIGAVLLQEGRPICYFSRRLGPRMRVAATYQKELFAIVEAVYKWWHYPLGRRFIIRTDHRSIKELMQQVIQTPIQHRYVRKLLGFDFSIEYKPGVHNQVADALSRLYEDAEPLMASFMVMSQPLTEFMGELKTENRDFEELRVLHQQLDQGTAADGFRRHERLIIFQDRYFIGEESKLKPQLLREHHDTPSSGHDIVKKMMVPLSIIPYPPGSSKVAAVDDALIERDALFRLLKQNLLAAKNRMEVQANRRRRDVEFAVGDKVFVKLQPYRQLTLARRLSNKLAKRYYGHLRRCGRCGKVAYRLALPADSKIHPVFHVSILKPFVGDSAQHVTDLPEEVEDGRPIDQPVAICGTRVILHKGESVQQVLVQWAGRSPDDATWEGLSEFQKAYPNYDLEDKVSFEERGNDTLRADSRARRTGPRRTTRVSVPPVWQRDFVLLH